MFKVTQNKSYIDDNYNYANDAKKEVKLIQNASEFTFNNKNIQNNYDNSDNNNNNDSKVLLITTSIDDKYKNLENPFTNPIIPKKTDEEEKRARIMERINRGRKKVKSQSVDNARYKKSEEIQRKADNLEKRLFKN